MSELIHVTSSPHVREKMDTQKIMLWVIISLLPATIFGIFNFGPRALLVLVLSICSCVASEYVYDRIVHKKNTISDLSAVVTGLLLGLNLPHTVSWFVPVLGGFFAIVVVKMLFGGLGQNFMNPALAARCFLLLSFTQQMTSFSYDGVTTATPLANLKAGQSVDPVKMLLGTEAGTIGETSVIALLIGAIILLLTGVIKLRIPATYLISFSVFILLFGGHGFDLTYLIEEICGGGLILGAFFMATDYVTSPITPNGQILYGILLGLLTGLFRIFGSSAEGVSYAIIISNLIVPLIERVTVPTAFGIVKEKKGGETK
ncbi:RnfABCDGE type electron transport complex subunit D [Lachnospiraceae bacterium YH-ros2228]|nr:RnfABCDGE type electron transport complex subunit D [Lachnospiraceae bacterium]MDD6449911.1 RnfABCDGE type electron transport complex subunit D [Lachnospiraceae bacterium]MDD6451720.1 RnfABCDGE type electron transport complex subunit D [Lachnospiraceae bacterium]MDD6578067.1 RnfABCDGE type electron transport complex subunit D [Lachnospiraceae bacterium]